MITRDIEGRKVLEIFERFIVDDALPKNSKVKAKLVYNGIGQQSGIFITGGSASTIDNTNAWNMTPMFASQSIRTESYKVGMIERILRGIFGRAKEIYVNKQKVPVQEVFEAILGGGRKLEVLTGRLEAHQDAIKEAKAMGQTALVEHLEARTAMVEQEAILFAAGFKGFIDEAQLIDFVEKCERGLKMDWIKNFNRLIPQDVRLKKIKMDSLNVFDNYVILHFDPLNKGSQLTKKEIEKKKDPILFGVMRGSRRLYHVGSWKDEFCDLTFGDLIDKFGKETLTLK